MLTFVGKVLDDFGQPLGWAVFILNYKLRGTTVAQKSATFATRAEAEAAWEPGA